MTSVYPVKSCAVKMILICNNVTLIFSLFYFAYICHLLFSRRFSAFLSYQALYFSDMFIIIFSKTVQCKFILLLRLNLMFVIFFPISNADCVINVAYQYCAVNFSSYRVTNTQSYFFSFLYIILSNIIGRLITFLKFRISCVYICNIKIS